MIKNHAGIWLRLLVLVAAVVGVVVFFVVAPLLGSQLVEQRTEYRPYYWPWLLFLWVCSVPCFASLFPGWQLFGRVGGNSAFCPENVQCLHRIACLISLDGVLFLVGNLVFLLLGMHRPGVFVASLFLSLALLAIGIAAAALEGLVERAAALREDSELTI